MGPGQQSRLAVLASISLPALALVIVGVAWVRRQRRRKHSTSGCPPEPPEVTGDAKEISPCSESPLKAAKSEPYQAETEVVPVVVSFTEPVSPSEIPVEIYAVEVTAQSEPAVEEPVVVKLLPEVESASAPVTSTPVLKNVLQTSEAEEVTVSLLEAEVEAKSDSLPADVEVDVAVADEAEEYVTDVPNQISKEEKKEDNWPVQIPLVSVAEGQIVHNFPDTPPASPPPSIEEEEISLPERASIATESSKSENSTIRKSLDSGISIDLDPVSEETKEVAPQQTDDGGAAVAEQAQPPREKFISERVIITTGRESKETIVPSATSLPASNPSQPQGKGKKGKKARWRRMMEGHGEQLAEKLAFLELARSERDSANQSPCDGMLASPGAYSDARSDGSSDSGKGHSDVATPAASLAGDPSPPTVYEFLVPQTLVGRLIGRHGLFLQEIMTLSHTNIFIKKHPESNKLKICAIEGGQPDIDKALDIIRKKFPARRYPKLTLERVSFVNMDTQLRPEDFHLSLVEGVNNDVVVSSLMTGGNFFVQQPSHPSYLALTALTQAMGSAYSDPLSPPPPLLNPAKDVVCVAPSMGGWYRVLIVAVKNDTCQIKFVDYGGYLEIKTAMLRQIRGDFLMLPFQAVECILANIRPNGDAWSDEARGCVHQWTFGRVLQAFVCGYAPETGIPLINLYTSYANQVVLVNEELVRFGLAQFIEEVEVYAEEDVPEENSNPQPIAAE